MLTVEEYFSDAEPVVCCDMCGEELYPGDEYYRTWNNEVCCSEACVTTWCHAGNNVTKVYI